MPRFCHSCGAAVVDRAVFCPACGIAVESGGAPVYDADRAARTEKRQLIRLGAFIASGVVLILLGIWASTRGGEPAPAPAAVQKHEENSVPATPPHVVTSLDNSAPASEVASTSSDSHESHELREDGRIYSVALIVATPEIPVGAKLFAQGRVATFGYADMRSRPFAVIQDEQEPRKALLCAMMADEGAEVFSLYRVGEVVAVSGEYMVTTGLAGYPPMPILSDCQVAGPQNNVVRPAQSRNGGTASSASVTTQPAIREEPIPSGPHRFVIGLLKNVHCDNPAMDLDVIFVGRSLALHTSNYFNVQYTGLNVTLKGDLNPCVDLEGRPAKVEYVDSASTGAAALLLGIEIHK